MAPREVIADYRLVHSADPDDFSNNISRLVRDGWQPLNKKGLNFVPQGYSMNYWMEMIKPVDEVGGEISGLMPMTFDIVDAEDDEEADEEFEGHFDDEDFVL